MAVHLSIGRIPSILLLALLGPAVAAGAAHYLSRPGPEAAPETAPASQITPRAPAAPTAAVAVAPPVAEAEAEVALEPEIEAVIAAVAEVEAASAADAVQTAPARPLADARQSQTGPAVAPVAPPAAPPAAAQGRVTVARLVVEPRPQPQPQPQPQSLRSPMVRDSARSTSRPRNLAPIPTRAPRAAKPGSFAARSAATLFQSGAEIRIKQDASVYITVSNIPENDRLLAAYNAERPNGGRVQTRFGAAAAVPGLLGIAAQAQRSQAGRSQAGRSQAGRSQAGGQGNPAYSLADAMRDAIWRKNTAARLKSLTTAQNACAEGADDIVKRTPSIGLIASC